MLSDSSAASSSSMVFTSSSSTSTSNATPNTSQQSFFEHHPQTIEPPHIPIPIPPISTPRKARSRQSTAGTEAETLRKPSFPGHHQSRKNSYAARHDINGTIMREGDVGNGMHTIRPVQRFDSVNSNRLSREYISERGNNNTYSNNNGGGGEHELPYRGKDAQMGRTIVEEVINPVIETVSAALRNFIFVSFPSSRHRMYTC